MKKRKFKETKNGKILVLEYENNVKINRYFINKKLFHREFGMLLSVVRFS